MNAVLVLNALIIVSILVSAFLAIRMEHILASVIALGVTGAFTSLEFIMLHAPDGAISEAAVGAVLSTTLFVIAVRKVTKKGDEEE